MRAFEFTPGTLPVLVAIPHAGTQLTPDISNDLVNKARALPDTDWHLARLYQFARDMGASTLVANYSRLVIDLNRAADGPERINPTFTGLYPDSLLDGTPCYSPSHRPDSKARLQALEMIWRPWHQQIDHELHRIKQEHGYALLLDAHASVSQLPRRFDGTLPDLCVGTLNGQSCSPALEYHLMECLAGLHGLTFAVNKQFKGGYTLKAWGHPEDNIHALQLVISRAAYMQEQAPYAWENKKAEKIQPMLKKVVGSLMACGSALA